MTRSEAEKLAAARRPGTVGPMLPIPVARRRLLVARKFVSLVGAARATIERGVAALIGPPEPSPPRPPAELTVDADALALDHLRAAWLTLRASGRTDAQVSQSLRLMLNDLESGRRDRSN